MLVRRCDVCGCDLPIYEAQVEIIFTQMNRPKYGIEACESCVAEIEAYINMMRRTSKEVESHD